MTSSYRIPDARPISPEESQLNYAQTQGLVMAEEQAQQEQVNNQKEAKATAPQTAKTQAENLQSLKEPTGLGGVAKEIGTAVVGAGIDAVEGIGSNLEQTFTGNLNNPKFVPTWLQVDDKVEPMNKTWWGQLTRSIGEYGLLSLATRGAGKGAAATKIPGLSGAGQFISSTGSTKTGALAREMARGVVVGNLSSMSLDDNATKALTQVFPWFPDVLATKDSDSPLLRRAKNSLESIGFDFLFDRIGAGIKAKMASQAERNAAAQAALETKVNEPKGPKVNLTKAQVASLTDELTPTPTVNKRAIEDLAKGLWNDEQLRTLSQSLRTTEYGTKAKAKPWLELADRLDKAASMTPVRVSKEAAEEISSVNPVKVYNEEIASNQKARQENFDEMAMSRYADDPEGVNGPDGYVNSPLFDKHENSVFSVKKDSLTKALLDAYRIDSDPLVKDGRVRSLFTEAALEKRLAGTDAVRRKIIESVAEKSLKGDDFIGEVNSVRVTRKEYKRLAVARAIDLFDDFSNPEDLDAFKAKMLDNQISEPIAGRTVKYLNAENFAAAELFINVTAGEMADIAAAAKSVRGSIDITHQENMLMRRMEFLLKETWKYKYLWGQRGNLIKDAGVNLIKGTDIDQAIKSIDDRVANTMTTLRQIRDSGDDRLINHFVDAMAISGGDVKTLAQMDQYMKDRIWKWGAASPEEQGGIIRGLQSTYINSVLSGPKTSIRAWTGTSLAVALRPLTTFMGGLARGDERVQAKALNQMGVWFEGFQEAMGMASTAWKNHLSGEGIPYSNFAGNTDALHLKPEWKALGDWVDARGNLGDKAGYGLATVMSRFNNFPLVSYSMGAMGAGDAANRTILGRMQLKSIAFDKAWDATGGKVDANLIRRYEEEFRNQIFDKDGIVTDKAATLAGDEAALTTELGDGFRWINDLVTQHPWTKPFLMFPKTGVNALKYSLSYNPLGTMGPYGKKVPIFNSFLKEVDEILNVTPDTIEAVTAKYAITDLAATQAMYEGRIAMGQVITLAAVGLWMNGALTGNGPAVKEERNAWYQSQWKPRSIKLADGVWVGYDSIDPFASLLALIADIGDNSNNNGGVWTETWLERVSYLTAMNLTNKTFLTGLQPLTELLSSGGAGRAVNNTASMLINGVVPFSSLRKELAEGFNPGMRELENDFRQQIANRNPGLKGQLPFKRDIIDGEPLRLYSPWIRAFNTVSPFQINPGWDQTRELLRKSGYDVAFTLRTDSKGRKLAATERSRMQDLMGDYGIGKKLDSLFRTQAYKDSYDLVLGLRDKGIPADQWPTSANYHTKAIDQIFREAKQYAEVRMSSENGDSTAVMTSRYAELGQQASKRGDTKTAEQYAELLQMLNK
jgi:hypothetical protein